MTYNPDFWMDDVEQTWGRDAADRWVMLRADVLATGVWHRDGVLDVVESLPIPRSLGERIYRWQDWYDREESPQEPGRDWEMTADWPIDAFAEEGLAVARELKGALPLDWTVVYFDLAALKRQGGWRTSVNRKVYEYEVAAAAPYTHGVP